MTAESQEQTMLRWLVEMAERGAKDSDERGRLAIYADEVGNALARLRAPVDRDELIGWVADEILKAFGDGVGSGKPVTEALIVAQAIVKRLRAPVDPPATFEVFVCPSCGPLATVDEDGLCVGCGVNTAVQAAALVDPPERVTRELLCQMCGRDYPIWSADSELWNAVMRDDEGVDEYPFACPTCFAIRAALMGVENAFHLTRSSTVDALRASEASALREALDVEALRFLRKNMHLDTTKAGTVIGFVSVEGTRVRRAMVALDQLLADAPDED